jgi:charged multivesicular body protein 1
MPIEQVYANMNQFEEAMDSIIVQGKVMDGLMNKNQDVGQDIAVDQMMQQLKQEQ